MTRNCVNFLIISRISTGATTRKCLIPYECMHAHSKYAVVYFNCLLMSAGQYAEVLILSIVGTVSNSEL